MSLATLTTLERRLESLEAENRRLDDENRKATGRPSREEEELEFLTELANRQSRQESAAMSAVKQLLEQQRQAERDWLSRCGIGDDADETLKRTMLAHRGYTTGDCMVFARLAISIAGETCTEGVVGMRDTIRSWGKLPMDVRPNLAAIAEAYHGCVVKINRMAC